MNIDNDIKVKTNAKLGKAFAKAFNVEKILKDTFQAMYLQELFPYVSLPPLHDAKLSDIHFDPATESGDMVGLIYHYDTQIYEDTLGNPVLPTERTTYNKLIRVIKQ